MNTKCKVKNRFAVKVDTQVSAWKRFWWDCENLLKMRTYRNGMKLEEVKKGMIAGRKDNLFIFICAQEN